MSNSHMLLMIALAWLFFVAAPGRGQQVEEPSEPSPAEQLAEARDAYVQAEPGQDQLRKAVMFSRMLLAHAREQTTQENWAGAAETYREAFEVAAAVSPIHAQCVLTHLRTMHHLQQAIVPLQEARERLASDPQNTALLRELIDLTITHTGDFAAAAKLVDSTLDETTRNELELAVADPSEVDARDCTALARWTNRLADQAQGAIRLMLLRRTANYCQIFLRASSAADQEMESAAQLLVAVLERIEGAGEAAVSLPTGVWIDMLGVTSIQPVSDAPPWRETSSGLASDPTAGASIFGHFPVVLEGQCELDMLFSIADKPGNLYVFMPAGELITGAAVGRNTNRLGERIERTGFAGDGGIHELRIRLTGGEGKYALSSDADGLPYMRCEELGANFARVLRDEREIDVGRRHIMLGTSNKLPAEVLAFSLKLTAGSAKWRNPAAPKPTRTRKMRVLADQPWQWITQVRAGDVVAISAEGQWSPGGEETVGPSGDDGGWYSLRGRLVDSGRTFTIGERTLVVATKNDVLKMEMDDANKTNNHGELDVTVKVFSETLPAVDDRAQASLIGYIASGDPAEDLELLYGQRIVQVRATPDAGDDVDLARRMLAAAAVVEDTPLAILLADRARDLAMSDPTGWPTAAAAIGQLLKLNPSSGEQYYPTLIALRQEMYEEATPARRSAAAIELFNALADSARNHCRAGRWDLAIQNYRQAQTLDDDAVTTLAESLTSQMNYAAERDAILRKRTELQQELSRQPDSTAIRRQLIVLNVAELADMKAAMELIGDDTDPTTRQALHLARRSLDTLSADEATALANWYRQLYDAQNISDEAKHSLLDRARQCCQTALAACDPESDTAVTAREMAEDIAVVMAATDFTSADMLSHVEWVDLLSCVDLNDAQATNGWLRQGETLIYHRPAQSKTPRWLAMPVMPRGDYDLKVDFTPISANGQLSILCPLLNPDNDSTWTVRVPIAAGKELVPRQRASVEISVRHSDGQAVINVAADGREIAGRTLSPGQPWQNNDAPIVYSSSLAVEGANSTLVLDSAQLRMQSGCALPLPPSFRQRWGRFRIDAQTPWQDTIELRRGDRVTMSAKGAWTVYFGAGPKYICSPNGQGEGEKRWGHLSARIGEGKPFFAGSDCTFTAESDGILRLQIGDAPGSLPDNMGYLTVTVRVEPSDYEQQ